MCLARRLVAVSRRNLREAPPGPPQRPVQRLRRFKTLHGLTVGCAAAAWLLRQGHARGAAAGPGALAAAVAVLLWSRELLQQGEDGDVFFGRGGGACNCRDCVLHTVCAR